MTLAKARKKGCLLDGFIDLKQTFSDKEQLNKSFFSSLQAVCVRKINANDLMCFDGYTDLTTLCKIKKMKKHRLTNTH